MPDQPRLITDQPEETAEDAARRAEYRERLREYLQDPDFRAIEGFPIGEDEDILALSDPPYYTACPNPFLPEILEQWQEERRQVRAELNLPEDGAYYREPFAADVSEGKNDPIYNAHSYHTKVPHKAIMRYILHYTEPGDVVFDGFCGTGMTGVAAQLCGDREAVQALGYRVLDDGTVLDEKGQPFSRLGARKAVLVDLCPAATFIAYNYNTPVNVAAFEREAKRILREVEDECGWMYETWHVEPASCRLLEQTLETRGGRADILSAQNLSARAGKMPASQEEADILSAQNLSARAGKMPASQEEADILSAQNLSAWAGKMPAPQEGGGRADRMSAQNLSAWAGKMPAPQSKGISEFTVRQGNLPHWQLPGAHYFITFNTANQRQLSPEARDIVLSVLKFWDGQRLDLIAAVVMPDHVHAVLAPREREPGVYWDLSTLMHSIKSYSANRINELEDRRRETVWQSETYDHIIRNLEEYHRILSYIAYNPVKARLAVSQWKYRWFWLSEDLERTGWKPAPRGRINYTVWSEVFTCPECSREIVFFDEALDAETKRVKAEFPCPHCGTLVGKRDLERHLVAAYDSILGQTVGMLRLKPVLIEYTIGRAKHTKRLDADDRQVIERVEQLLPPDTIPSNPLPIAQMYHGSRIAPKGVTHLHHFFLPRARHALAALWSRANQVVSPRLRAFMLFTVEQTIWGMSLLNRYQPIQFGRVGGSQVNRYLTGVYYISSLISEVSPWYILDGKVKRLVKAFGGFRQQPGVASISTQSTTADTVLPNSIDYIFTDPPFGENIYYADLNYLVESWHNVYTDSEPEAIVDRAKDKRLADYQELMRQAFCAYYRLLKPGRWMTVEFHNSHNAVWNAIQEALQRAGFVVADVRTLDKQQKSYRQVTAASVAKQDLVISAYKPNEGLESRFALEAGTEEGAWDFLQYHLGRLPVPALLPSPSGGGAGGGGGQLEMLTERQDYLLYDRMVAFHVQRGASVPLSAAQVYAGLRERFPERDTMFFLPDQAAEYDRRRLQAAEVIQLPLIVTDEKSAIQWLRLHLEQQPRTLGDLQPLFMREAQRAWEKNEQPLELRQLLEENFLEDEQDRWYVPDPNKSQDLERLRERSLLREFRQYAEGKGRLKVFRKEAVVAGFRRAWRDKDYATIVQVARRLPSRVLQEDPALLMYYDNAAGRVEG